MTVFTFSDGVMTIETAKPSEWFSPTNDFRWIMPEGYEAGGTNLPAPILQQREQGSQGTVIWRRVPVVGVPLAEFEAAAAETP